MKTSHTFIQWIDGSKSKHVISSANFATLTRLDSYFVGSSLFIFKPTLSAAVVCVGA